MRAGSQQQHKSSIIIADLLTVLAGFSLNFVFMEEENKKSAEEASKGKSDKTVKTINVKIGGKSYAFDYTVAKTTDETKKDRYWDFRVTHDNSDLPLPKSIFKRHVWRGLLS